MTDTHHTRPGLCADRWGELMLRYPMRGWHLWTMGCYLIINRDVHLVRRGQLLECGRCVRSCVCCAALFSCTPSHAIHAYRCVYIHLYWCVYMCESTPQGSPRALYRSFACVYALCRGGNAGSIGCERIESHQRDCGVWVLVVTNLLLLFSHELIKLIVVIAQLRPLQDHEHCCAFPP